MLIKLNEMRCKRSAWYRYGVIQPLSRVTTLCCPMDCSLPGSSVYVISQVNQNILRERDIYIYFGHTLWLVGS